MRRTDILLFLVGTFATPIVARAQYFFAVPEDYVKWLRDVGHVVRLAKEER